MYRDFEETKKAIERDGAIIKDVFYGHSGYVILWFDTKGYSVTEVTRNGAGTGGVLTWEKGREDFIKTVTRLMNYD